MRKPNLPISARVCERAQRGTTYCPRLLAETRNTAPLFASRRLVVSRLSQLQHMHLARHAGDDHHIVGQKAQREDAVLVHADLPQQPARVGAIEGDCIVERTRGEQLCVWDGDRSQTDKEKGA